MITEEQYESMLKVAIDALAFYEDEEQWQDDPESLIADEGTTAKCAIHQILQMRREFEQKNMMDKLGC